MEPKNLVSEKLITLVLTDWWTNEEGHSFLKRQELKQEWVKLLNQLGCNVWFTLTFRNVGSGSYQTSAQKSVQEYQS